MASPIASPNNLQPVAPTHIGGGGASADSPIGHPTLLILGPTPPPYHGVSVAMRTVLQSHIMDRFKVVVLDTADRRDISHVENPDWHDVILFLRQFCKNIYCIVRYQPALFYIPICQTRIGFLRDTFFMVPAFLAGCRVVVHLHGGTAFSELFLQGGIVWRRLMSFVLQRVARFIVLGEVHRPIFANWISPECISVVPNGIEDPPSALSESPHLSGSSRTRFRIVYLSTLSQGKGLFILLEAMSLIIRQCSNVECAIAGQWGGSTTKVEADQLVANLGLNEVVSFAGPVSGENKTAFLRTGDIFVFPSIYPLEGQPLVILEAMCAGLPVIASDIGSLSETVEEGVTGFVVPQNDPQAVCEKVLMLFRDEKLRRSMSKAGRTRFERLYTSRIFAKNLEQVFLETLDR